MEKRSESDEHPVLLQTTVVNQSTGQPVYTLIKLPPGTTIESLASIFTHTKSGNVNVNVSVNANANANHCLEQSRNLGLGLSLSRNRIYNHNHNYNHNYNASDSDSVKPTLKKEVVPLGRLVHESSDESLDDGKATTTSGEESPDDEARDERASCVSDDTRSEPDRDNLATPPTSPGVATFLSLIPEPQRAGCHNSHKASILGGRYVLQKTNSRARLTGPFFCNACGLRFDWHSSARMHLNFHNRDFEACDKCQKRQNAADIGGSGGGGGGNGNSGCGGGGGAAERTGRPPRCTVCNKSFYLWKTYLAHQDKHKDKVKCPLCCKFFQSLHNVGRHYYDEHNGVPVTCSLCGNGYRAFKQYQTHVETIHMGGSGAGGGGIGGGTGTGTGMGGGGGGGGGGDDNLAAKGVASPSYDDAINYSIDLPTLQQLDPSIRVFSSVERTCPVPNCGRVFSTQHTMQRHIYDVHSNELLPCGLCGNAYRTYTQFEHHCELFHGENFRVELPVGEISVPLKRKRERERERVASDNDDSHAGKHPTNRSPRQPAANISISSSSSSSGHSAQPLDEPLDMTVVKQEPSDDVILPD